MPAVQAGGNGEDARLKLMTAAGISPLAKLKITDIAPRQLTPDLLPKVEEIVSTAMARRPDLLGAYAAQKVSQIVLADNSLRTSLAAHSASKEVETAAQATFDAALATGALGGSPE